jgi:DNA recombination protein RmuC
MDFVVMFVPRAAALWTALAEDHALWRDAFEKNVYIADEQSLYAMLRMVKMTWRQVQQAQNQQKVFELANEVLKRVGIFVKNMDEIGAALGKAQEAYNKGKAKLDDKGQSIVQSCRKLERLGAKQDSKNPLPPDVDAIEMQTVEDVSEPEKIDKV